MTGTSRRAAFAFAALAFGLYLATGQRRFHGFDAYHYLRCIATGEFGYAFHAFYLPVAAAWSRLLAGFGVELHTALRCLSAIAAAAGVYASHRAAVGLQLGAERAALTALGAATMPAVVHAATVVEIDAITFCGFCWAWVPFARLLRDAGALHAIAVGACTGLTSGFHAAAHLGVAALCATALAWWWRARPLSVTAARLAAIAGTHLAIVAAVHVLVGGRGQLTMATNTLQLALPVALLPEIVWREFLLPYAPLGLLAFAIGWRRERRAVAACLLLLVAGYLTFATCVIANARLMSRFGPNDGFENGSFLLTLAPGFAVLAAAALPRATAWLAVGLAAVSGLVQQRLGDWPPDPPGHASGWAQVTAGRPSFTMFADAEEWAWVARRHPEVRATVAAAIRVQLEGAARQNGQPVHRDTILVWFGVESDSRRAAGGEWFLSDRALTALRAAPDPELAAAAGRLGEVYRLQRHAADGYVAWTVHPR